MLFPVVSVLTIQQANIDASICFFVVPVISDQSQSPSLFLQDIDRRLQLVFVHQVKNILLRIHLLHNMTDRVLLHLQIHIQY